MLKLFDGLEATGDKAVGRRTMLLTRIRRALAKHAIEEENMIYPAPRTRLAEEKSALITRAVNREGFKVA